MSSRIIIFIFLSFLFCEILSTETLKKYSTFTTIRKYAIFESKEFSIGDKMYFKLTTSEEQNHSLELKYEYFTTKTEAQINLDSNYIPKNSVSSQVSQSSSLGSIGTYSRFFTIEKKSSELGDSNGDYLLLYYNFDGEIKFENTKSSGETKIIIIIIVVFVVFIVVTLVIIVFCYCCCFKRRRSYGYVQSLYPVMPMPLYGQGPIYVQGPGYQQGQMLVQPQGQMIVQQGQINPQNGNNVLSYSQQVVVSNNNQVAAPYNNANNQNNPIPYNNSLNIPQTSGGQTPQSKDYLNEKYK